MSVAAAPPTPAPLLVNPLREGLAALKERRTPAFKGR